MAVQIIIEYANEAAEIVADLVETVEEHKDLSDAEIVCLFTSQKLKNKDRAILGKSSKPGALLRFFASGHQRLVEAGPDFILLFPREQWAGLNAERRAHLVDHELTHCYKKIKVKKSGEVVESWALRSHDLEEFHSVVKRRGLLFPDVKEFAEVVRGKQLELTQPAVV